MLPTRWDGKDIVVMDQVVVKGPGYRTEDCKAGKEAGSALTRVRKVVSDYSLLAKLKSGVVRAGCYDGLKLG